MKAKSKSVKSRKSVTPKKKLLTMRQISRGAGVNAKSNLSHSAMVALDVIRRKSTFKNPVEKCWEIFNENPGMRRKDVINLCLKHGVAFYTARTQYQYWKAAGKKK